MNTQIINEIQQHIEDLSKEISILSNIANYVQRNDEEASKNEITKYITITEKNLLKRRNMYNFNIFEQASITKLAELPTKEIINSLNFNITFDKNWYRITMPEIPNKRVRVKSKWLWQTIYAFISDYQKKCIIEGNPPIRFDNATVVFVHHLDRNRPILHIPDADNLDVKTLIDLLSTVFFTSDSLVNLHSYVTAVLDVKAYTEIYIMEQKSFELWLNQHENIT